MKKGSFSIAQGTVEYLVIVAVIIVIGLIVVGVASSFLDSSGGISSGIGGLSSIIDPISITETVVDSDGNGYSAFQNNSGETLTVTKITLGDVDNNYNKTVVSGGAVVFELNNLSSGCTCTTPGETKTCSMIIYYTSSSGLSQTETNSVTVDCVSDADTPQTPIVPTPPPDITPPSISLSGPVDRNFDTNSTRVFSYTVDNNSDVASCELLINGVNDQNDFSASGLFTKTFSSEGKYYWDVNCTDSSGNEGTSDENRSVVYFDTTYMYSLQVGEVQDYSLVRRNLSGESLQNIGVLAITTTNNNLAVDSQGNIWFDSNNYEITKYSSSLSYLGSYNVGRSFNSIAIDGNDTVWAANWIDSNIVKLYNNGLSAGSFSVGSNPVDIAIDSNGNVWVANSGSDNVTKLYNDGSLGGTFDVGNNPTSLAVDSSNNVWITNQDANTITKLSQAGSLIGTYNTGYRPDDIAVDGEDNVWYGTSEYTVVYLSENNPLVKRLSFSAQDESEEKSKIFFAGGSPVNDYDPIINKMNQSGVVTYSEDFDPQGTGYSEFVSGISIDADGNILIIGNSSHYLYAGSMGWYYKVDNEVLSSVFIAGTSIRGYGDVTGFALKRFAKGWN